MVQVIKMENQTAQRAMFIANQTGSIEMGDVERGEFRSFLVQNLQKVY